MHDDIKKQIEQIDDFIQKQIQYSEQIDAALPAAAANIATLAPDVAFLTGKADAVELALDNDAHAVKGAKDVVLADADDARLSFRSVDNLKLPPHLHYSNFHGVHQNSAVAALHGDDGSHGFPAPVDLIAYFDQRADKLDEQLKRYLSQVAEIEAHLRTMEVSAVAETEALLLRRSGQQINGNNGEGRLRELARTMKLFEEAIFKVATGVGGVREELVELTVGNGLSGARGSVNGGRGAANGFSGNVNGASGAKSGFGSPFSTSRVGTPNGRRGWS